MPRAHYHSLLVPDLTCQYRDNIVQRHSSLIVVWRVWKPVKAAPMFWGEFVSPSVWKRFIFCCVNMNVMTMLGPVLLLSHQATTAWHCHPSIVKMSGKVERRLLQQYKLIPWDMSFPVFHRALIVSVSVFHRALSLSVSVFHRPLNLSVSVFHRVLSVSVSVFHRALNLSVSVFHRALNLSVSVFHRPLSVSVSVFHRALNLSVSVFHRALSMSVSVFHRPLSVSVSVFHRALNLSVSVFHRALSVSVSVFHRPLNVSVSVFHRAYTPGCIIPLSWTLKQLHADAVLIDQMAKVVASQSIQYLCWWIAVQVKHDR